MKTRSKGQVLLEKWFAKTMTGKRVFARSISAAPASVTRWLNGERQPNYEFRMGIAFKTRGAVPHSSWDEPSGDM